MLTANIRPTAPPGRSIKTVSPTYSNAPSASVVHRQVSYDVMIRTQVRCDKRVSFRDRQEGWTCVCPSPGVARTHAASRTESLVPGTLGKHGPGPRHRPYEVAGAKKHQRRLQPHRLSPGVQDHGIKPRRLTNGPCYTLHSITAALPARSRNPDITADARQ